MSTLTQGGFFVNTNYYSSEKGVFREIPSSLAQRTDISGRSIAWHTDAISAVQTHGLAYMIAREKLPGVDAVVGGANTVAKVANGVLSVLLAVQNPTFQVSGSDCTISLYLFMPNNCVVS